MSTTDYNQLFWEALRADPSANFLDAAHAAGFGSYAQFYRIFKQAYGGNPRAVLGGNIER